MRADLTLHTSHIFCFFLINADGDMTSRTDGRPRAPLARHTFTYLTDALLSGLPNLSFWTADNLSFGLWRAYGIAASIGHVEPVAPFASDAFANVTSALLRDLS